MEKTFCRSTEELNHEISMATDIEDYLTANRNQLLSGSLSEYLQSLLFAKQMKKADVVRGSCLDRGYLYQIFAGQRLPSRDKLLAIAFGLTLSADETQKLLKFSGDGELYARNERDAIILFSLLQGFSLLRTNELLYEHNQPTIN